MTPFPGVPDKVPGVPDAAALGAGAAAEEAASIAAAAYLKFLRAIPYTAAGTSG